ncbi:MAG: hypothetical protein WEG36_16480 [Gemmatimonadota bacterium]
MRGPAASPMEIRLRGILLLVLLAGMIGTGVELVLLEHMETMSQLIPILAIAAGIVSAIGVAIGRTPGTIRILQFVMASFVLSGGLGVYYHYKGNIEFELETYPTMAGFELFRESMMGAFPALAPGAMAWLGLLGLAFAYKHPWVRNNGPTMGGTS